MFNHFKLSFKHPSFINIHCDVLLRNLLFYTGNYDVSCIYSMQFITGLKMEVAFNTRYLLLGQQNSRFGAQNAALVQSIINNIKFV